MAPPWLAVLTEEARGVLPGERRVIERFPFAVAQDRAPEIVCWGDGSATREFLDVEDCAEAIGLATERYDGAEPVNVGAGFEVSITELVALVAALTGLRGRLAWDPSKPKGEPQRGLDVSRAERVFGFRARTPFRDGGAKPLGKLAPVARRAPRAARPVSRWDSAGRCIRLARSGDRLRRPPGRRVQP